MLTRQRTNASSTQYPTSMYLWLYVSAELFVCCEVVLMNVLVIYVYCRHATLRTITNTYIFSLALADLLTGLCAIPITAISVVTQTPSDFFWCLSVHSSVIALCTVSIMHLLVIAIDKYLSICNKHVWQHKRRHKRAAVLMAMAWGSGVVTGFLPFVCFTRTMRNNYDQKCHFMAVVDMRFLVHVVFLGTILVPTAIIMLCYLAIYRRLHDETSRLKHCLSLREIRRRGRQRRAVIRSLFICVLGFVACWYPLYILNTYMWWTDNTLLVPVPVIWMTVVLSHASSGINPIIYAMGMPQIRQLVLRRGTIPPSAQRPLFVRDLHAAASASSLQPAQMLFLVSVVAASLGRSNAKESAEQKQQQADQTKTGTQADSNNDDDDFVSCTADSASQLRITVGNNVGTISVGNSVDQGALALTSPGAPSVCESKAKSAIQNSLHTEIGDNLGSRVRNFAKNSVGNAANNTVGTRMGNTVGTSTGNGTSSCMTVNLALIGKKYSMGTGPRTRTRSTTL